MKDLLSEVEKKEELYIEVSEELEFNRIQKSIQNISGSMIRLGVDINGVTLRIPSIDFDYIVRLIKSNRNWSGVKYCKIISDDVVSVNNVKVLRGH
jgi:hypothetical protein